MQRDGKNVYIFPLSINYDRLFEIRNIADMMVSKN
jgi:glycerol-3-phosphate O-acyltransferase